MGYVYICMTPNALSIWTQAFFMIIKSLKNTKLRRKKFLCINNFLVEHKKNTEEIVRVKKEKDAVTATLAKRNDQLIDAVKRAREAIKVLQPVAVSVFLILTNPSSTQGFAYQNQSVSVPRYPVR